MAPLRSLSAAAAALWLLCPPAEAAGEAPTGLAPGYFAEPLRRALTTDWRIVPVSDAGDEDFRKATALVPDFTMAGGLAAMLGKMDAGRLLQIPFTGLDRLNLSAVPPRFAVCNVHNAAVAIPEYVMAALLSWNVRLPTLDAEFRKCTWGTGPNRCERPPPHVQTKGQTIGIVGYGALGSGVAQRAAAFGMRAVAVTMPVPEKTPQPLAWVGGDKMLPKLMEEADFVVVTCPLLDSTRGMVSAAAIGRMKATGVLINVARGPVVDEDGLFAALKEQRIGGAILDVWWHEDWSSNATGPASWPSVHNFSALPNVWMTPHTSYNTDGTLAEGVREAAANFDRLARGEPLENVVRPAGPGTPELALI